MNDGSLIRRSRFLFPLPLAHKGLYRATRVLIYNERITGVWSRRLSVDQPADTGYHVRITIVHVRHVSLYTFRSRSRDIVCDPRTSRRESPRISVIYRQSISPLPLCISCFSTRNRSFDFYNSNVTQTLGCRTTESWNLAGFRFPIESSTYAGSRCVPSKNSRIEGINYELIIRDSDRTWDRGREYGSELTHFRQLIARISERFDLWNKSSK